MHILLPIPGVHNSESILIHWTIAGPSLRAEVHVMQVVSVSGLMDTASS